MRYLVYTSKFWALVPQGIYLGIPMSIMLDVKVIGRAHQGLVSF
jgi:hypothetical protein